MKLSIRGVIVLAFLTLIGCSKSPQSDAGKWTDILKEGNMDMFREPVGTWITALDVVLDPENEQHLTYLEGSGVLVSGRTGQTTNLLTKMEYGDIEAHIEFMVPAKSNSGVYFQGRYEIQVLDSWGVENPQYLDCGGIYQRWADNKGFEGRAPRVNACRKPGEWQSYDVIFKAPRFDKDGNKIANAVFVKVVHNGILIHENQEVAGPTRSGSYEDEAPLGPLMFQGDHGPVAYRNIRVRPINFE